MLLYHAYAVLFEYTVAAGLVYRSVIDIRLICLFLPSSLVLKANAPLAAYRQFHVRAYFPLIEPAAPVIAIYHILTRLSGNKKAACSFASRFMSKLYITIILTLIVYFHLLFIHTLV